MQKICYTDTMQYRKGIIDYADHLLTLDFPAAADAAYFVGQSVDVIIDGTFETTTGTIQSISGAGSLASYLLNLAADNTSGAVSSVLSWVAKGAAYSCYVDGKAVSYQTSVKYPVLAGGIAVSTSPSGTVKSMVQLVPINIDKLGAASAMSGSKRYELADDMQVYLWYKGQYYATTLSQVNAEDHHLIGWYDSLGCAAGGKIRVLIAVKND